MIMFRIKSWWLDLKTMKNLNSGVKRLRRGTLVERARDALEHNSKRFEVIDLL